MKIIVNGNESATEEGITLLGLLQNLSMPIDDKGIAIALNEELVRRSDWGTTKLQAGMKIEIVYAVAGG